MSKPDTTSMLFRRFWSDYLYVHRGRMLAAFALMTIEGSTLALISWMLKPLFDRVFIGKETGAIWWVGTAIFAIFLTRAIT
ncbi:MAG: ABC transporter ATP-binding protein, partial [Paracoccus sp. (in: a-proteobacteria)]